jgi:trk system potassium uptake protein TrkH
MSKLKNWLEHTKNDERSVLFLLIKGYFFLSVICLILLLLPFSQDEPCSLVNHIFFSMSIVSTTGLAPADFGSTYNLFGHLISLFFIQIGGIGYMALSSFIILKQRKRLPSLSARLLKLEFNLPPKYPLVDFIYSVFIFTFLIEFLGTILLYIGFKNQGLENPLWNAIFHSISAFCTAGFSLFSDSMIPFQDNGLITNTILVLSLLGSIGFIVLLDFWMKIIRRRKSITLTSKIILIGSFTFWIAASIFIYLSDPALYELGWRGLKIAIFQSISAHTTVGFNNFDLSALNYASTFIIIVLMIVGASPAGTGGGIKVTSITALLAVLTAILKRKKHITFLRKEIPAGNIYLAISSTVFYLLILIIGTWLVLMVEGSAHSFEKILFEIASALSTVGLSSGITADLKDTSKLIISLWMFIGRLGVLTFGLALISENPLIRKKPEIEDIAI